MSVPKAAVGPLVEPGPELTPAEIERYSRHLLIPEIGALGQRRLTNARVLVIGAGGLGSPVLLYLAAAGVGTIGIVERDTVDLSNLQRQIIHGNSDLGRSKIDSAMDAVAELNPHVTVQPHRVWLDPTNALQIFADYDVIIDGSDNFATRYLVSDAAALLGKPCVWGSVLRFDGQVSVFWNEHGPTYRDLYPEAPAAGTTLSCGEGGVFGMLCGTIGSTMVAETIKLITGVGRTLLGRVVVFNALDATWRELVIGRDPAASPVTALVDYEAFCGTSTLLAQTDTVSARQLATMLAERERGERSFDLVDVREPEEHAIAKIKGAQLVPLGRILAGGNLDAFGQNHEIVLHCKSGARSATALAELRSRGFTNVRHLDGGIEAWAALPATAE